MRSAILSFFIIVGLFVSQSFAQAITVNDSPRPFSVKPPNSWIQKSTSTGNSLIRFVSPSGTPPAECAVIVKELSLLKDIPQTILDQQSLEPIDPEAMRQQLSSLYNNVQISNTGIAIISSYPAQTVQVQYSTGTPDGELWARVFTNTTKTTPGLVWTTTCGALGFTPEAAQKGFSYWQSELVMFSTHLKIHETNYKSTDAIPKEIYKFICDDSLAIGASCNPKITNIVDLNGDGEFEIFVSGKNVLLYQGSGGYTTWLFTKKSDKYVLIQDDFFGYDVGVTKKISDGYFDLIQEYRSDAFGDSTRYFKWDREKKTYVKKE